MPAKSYFKNIENTPAKNYTKVKKKFKYFNFPLCSLYVNPEETEEAILEENNSFLATIKGTNSFRYINPIIKFVLFIGWPLSMSYFIVLNTDFKDSWRFLVLLLTVTYWLLEVIPIGITSLFPILIRCFIGKLYMRRKPGLFLLLLLIASLGFSKWHIHKRIALRMLTHLEATPQKIIGGVIILSMLSSLFMSELVAVVVFMPVSKYMIHYLNMARLLKLNEEGNTIKEKRDSDIYFQKFTSLLKLSIPFSSTIGAPLFLWPYQYILKFPYFYVFIIMIPIIIQNTFCLWMVMISQLLGLSQVFQWKKSSENSYLVYVINEEKKVLGQLKSPEKVIIAVFVFFVINRSYNIAYGMIFGDEISHLDTFAGIDGKLVFAIFLLFIIPSHLPNLYIFRKCGLADSSKLRGFSETILSYNFITQGVPWGEVLFVIASIFLDEIIVTSHSIDSLLNEVLNNDFGLDINLMLFMLFGMVTTPFVSNNMCMILMQKIASKLMRKGFHPIYFYVIGSCTPCFSFIFRISNYQNCLAYACGGILKKQMFVIGFYMTIISNVIVLFSLSWVSRVFGVKDIELQNNITSNDD